MEFQTTFFSNQTTLFKWPMSTSTFEFDLTILEGISSKYNHSCFLIEWPGPYSPSGSWPWQTPNTPDPSLTSTRLQKTSTTRWLLKLDDEKRHKKNVWPNSPSCWQFKDGPLIETPETLPLPLHGIKMLGILPPVMQCKCGRKMLWFPHSWQ